MEIKKVLQENAIICFAFLNGFYILDIGESLLRINVRLLLWQWLWRFDLRALLLVSGQIFIRIFDKRCRFAIEKGLNSIVGV